MSRYAYTPTNFNGNSLTGGNLTCRFRERAGPLGPTRTIAPVTVDVIGRGPSDVRGQPRAARWELWVALTAVDETDLDAFFEIFDEEAGLVFLQATDGAASPVTWRVKVRVTDIERRGPNLFIVNLYVPTPVWEQQTLQSATESAIAVSQVTWNMTNAGNRKARPTFEIKGIAVKTNDADDYARSLRGFIVNRSPRWWNDKPIQIFDDGGASGTIDHAALVTAGDAQADGDDLRVWLNGVEVPRYLAGLNTTTCKCWVNVTMPPRLVLTLPANITAISPADGGEQEFEEGVAGLPERGQFAIENEIISYQARDVANRKVTGIQRGAHGTTAAAHTAATAPAFHCDVLFVVAIDKSTATAPPPVSNRDPAQSKPDSTNVEWRYGISSVFWDPNDPERTAMFRPSLEVPEQDQNFAQQLRLEDGPNATWEDSEPIAGKPPIPRLVLDLPQGMPAAANKLQYDVQQQNAMRMRIIGVDRYGNEVDITDNHGTSLIDNQQITPDADIFQLILNATRAAVCGNADDTTEVVFSGLFQGRFQKVVLDQETEISAVQAMLRKGGAGDSFTYTVQMRDGTGATPDQGRIVALYDTADVGALTAAALSTVKALITFTSSSGSIRVPAGTYWLAIAISVYTSGSLRWRVGNPRTKHNEIYDAVTPAFGSQPAVFRVIHEGGGPVQEETELLNAASEGYFDDLRIRFGTLSGDAFSSSPYVDRDGGFTQLLYHCVGKITNMTTGDFIDIDAWLDVSDSGTIQIDCENRTVIISEKEHVVSLPAAIRPSNREDWMPLKPGVNAMQYDELNMVDTDILHQFRSKRV